jgi:enoyl-[acyl-carrier protein] reductase II
VVIEEGVKIVETAGRNPGEYIKRFKDAGLIVRPMSLPLALPSRERERVELVGSRGRESGPLPSNHPEAFSWYQTE